MAQAFTDISFEELEQLSARVEHAMTHKYSLTPEDSVLLIKALASLMSLHSGHVSDKVTLQKLRKLAGLVKSSETMQDLFGNNADKPPRNRSPKKPKPKITVEPEVIEHKHQTLKAGETCSECGKGKLATFSPATLLRVVGAVPFSAKLHKMEKFRCNACGAYFTAEVPDEVIADGDKGQRYGYSARTIMALNKFFAGSPYCRQESMQTFMGMSLSASTVFDQTEKVANCLKPVYDCLLKIASNAKSYYIDDTHNKILDKVPIEKPKRNNKNGKKQKRTGVYSSGIVAVLDDGKEIVLYQTNIGHAGEFIDELLAKRDESTPLPLVMSDALSHNKPSKVYSVSYCLCNSHGRRGFAEHINFYPEEMKKILEWYGKIWENDKEASRQNLSAAKRLAWHQTHSLPMMEKIQSWGQGVLETQEVEENSSLGKVINYFNEHYHELTAFCRFEGAALDNNRVERALKLVVRNRKNALFFKTQIGATLGDIITSLIATASELNVNLFEYFNLLQRKQDEVKANPEFYLPWNYRSQL